MPRRDRIGKRSGPPDGSQTGSYWARLFEEPRVAGTEPAGRKQTDRRSPPPTPALCPESSCAPRGEDRARVARPPVAALIGRRLGQQRGRHVPGPGRADKACQGAHDSRLGKSAWAGAPKESRRGPGRPSRFSSLRLWELLGGGACISAELGVRQGQTSAPPRSSPPLSTLLRTR